MPTTVSFVTANNKNLLTPTLAVTKQPMLDKKANLFSKPGVKVRFNNFNQPGLPIPDKKRRLDKENYPQQHASTVNRVNASESGHVTDQNSSIPGLSMPKSSGNFDHCTFNNCTFNINSCRCNY